MSIFSKIKQKILYEIKLRLCCSLPGLKYLKSQNTKFIHPIGICIVEEAKIGKNCTIAQNVTIGCGKYNEETKTNVPIIGNNVTIYANATVIGGIVVGDNSVIGANSVVVKNVLQNTVVAGNPAQIIKNIN